MESALFLFFRSEYGELLIIMGVFRRNIQGISLENLEQWGEEAGEGFPDFISLGAEFPPVEGDLGTFFEVV